MLLGGRASRGIAESSLLPLLYNTRTITRAAYATDQLNLEQKAGEGAAEEQRLQNIKQKWSSRKSLADRPRRRTRRDEPTSQRMQSARSRPQQLQSIPFDGNTGSATPAERLQNTTMTPREMQVFEELFRKGVSSKQATAEAQKAAKKTPSKTRTTPQFPELLRPLAEEAQHLRQQAASSDVSSDKQPGLLTKPIAELDIKDPQAMTIRDLMNAATTDIECWEVLRDHVFDRLRATPSDSALQANFPALPALLQHYMYLQTEKLSSQHSLGLVALSELKRIGPLAFALGATTELYNAHMRLLWRQYRDLQSIDDFLAEMDREVYEVDAGTLGLLEEILDHARAALDGALGESVKALWTMDRKLRGVKRIREWKRIVDERLREKALTEAKSKQEVFQEDEADEGYFKRERVRPRRRRLAPA
ncbi:Putative protein Mtf2/C5D6.12 [Septoria linicola]|uniref:Mtf2-like C-terminal domain-containing protein n=1 Tax=Septoria linicola TaxID=215465 RepID=A0A9Q9B2I2_9PEZI|nr:putative protein Mtf2/C5D6.12 [Septoria linicola]USW56368.1 Putative protein Mtf2/C5D6.12 [Septoria linicola]